MTRAALIASLAVAAACGGDTEGGPDAGDDAPIRLRGACAMADRLGGFRVDAHADQSSVEGRVADGVTPTTVLTETAADGDCKLLQRPNPFCDPACGADQVCDLAGTCIAQPVSQDVGVVTISGLAAAVEMAPVAPGNNYFATGLPHPVFAAGDPLRLRSTDGVYGALSLDGEGVAPVTVSGTEWTVERGTALALAWSPPPAGSRAAILVELNVDQHGDSPVTLRCELPDTGAATVSASMIDALLDAGVSGFPRGSLTRRTVDSHDVDIGCVELVVAAPRPHTVRLVD